MTEDKKAFFTAADFLKDLFVIEPHFPADQKLATAATQLLNFQLAEAATTKANAKVAPLLEELALKNQLLEDWRLKKLQAELTRTKAARKNDLERIGGFCGNPDAAEGCRIITKYIREAGEKIERGIDE